MSMSSSSITSWLNAASTSSSTTETESSEDLSTLDKDDFLQLLIAELQYQDPLDPATNTEFVAQLAQFSSLEQMTTMNENIETLVETVTDASTTMTSSMLVDYLGKSVLAESAEFVFDGENSATLNFNLDSAAASGTLTIYNSDEEEVYSVSIGAQDSGNHYFTWDGTTSSGGTADSGTYYFEVSAVDSSGSDVEWTAMMAAEVDGVTTTSDGETYLYADGVYLKADQIRYVYAETEETTETEDTTETEETTETETTTETE